MDCAARHAASVKKRTAGARWLSPGRRVQEASKKRVPFGEVKATCGKMPGKPWNPRLPDPWLVLEIIANYGV